ncbi:DUF3253 domain-containing protein [Streptomyces sp. NPDC088812]|uniref:DUF3253 domain-containing protein n=1 Tax=Streptomyces sp. NPDC088812 TaxID=3365905 RepID=UPI00382CAD25
MSDVEAELARSMLELLSRRAPGASICPSEAARAVRPGGGEDWRALMEPTRRAARRLAAEGLVEITRGGRVVDPSEEGGGPVRIRRVP